jgi:hypothetical protein
MDCDCRFMTGDQNMFNHDTIYEISCSLRKQKPEHKKAEYHDTQYIIFLSFKKKFKIIIYIKF